MKLVLFLVGLLCTSLFAQDIVTIVIDPGHGGKDPGHLSLDSKHLQEKDINLLIAEKLGFYLENNVQNVKVIYTRTTDVYPTLDERIDISNQKNVDLFISIHCNGSPNTVTNGTETHIYDRSSKESLKWAKIIEKEFTSRVGRNSRGIKTNDDRGNSLQVLKYTKMTSVLVECGFLTNTSEAVFLNSTRGQDLIASALFRATRTYIQSSYKNVDLLKKIPVVDPKKEEPKLAEGKYRVQICSSAINYDLKGEKFSHLKYSVYKVVVGGKVKYKYFLGPFTNKKEAEIALENAQKGGYKDAFIVAN